VINVINYGWFRENNKEITMVMFNINIPDTRKDPFLSSNVKLPFLCDPKKFGAKTIEKPGEKQPANSKDSHPFYLELKIEDMTNIRAFLSIHQNRNVVEGNTLPSLNFYR
jgi:hypothetical protein